MKSIDDFIFEIIRHATISEGIKMFNLFMNNAMQVSTVNDNKNSYLPHSVTMSL